MLASAEGEKDLDIYICCTPSKHVTAAAQKDVGMITSFYKHSVFRSEARLLLSL